MVWIPGLGGGGRGGAGEERGGGVGGERDAGRERPGDRQQNRWLRQGAGAGPLAGLDLGASRARENQSIPTAASGLENKCKHPGSLPRSGPRYKVEKVVAIPPESAFLAKDAKRPRPTPSPCRGGVDLSRASHKATDVGDGGRRRLGEEGRGWEKKKAVLLPWKLHNDREGRTAKTGTSRKLYNGNR